MTNEQKFILTNRQTYTPLEAVDTFSEYVKPENLQLLIDHISYPELAKYVISFTEINGELHFNLGNGGELIKVTKKNN